MCAFDVCVSVQASVFVYMCVCIHSVRVSVHAYRCMFLCVSLCFCVHTWGVKLYSLYYIFMCNVYIYIYAIDFVRPNDIRGRVVIFITRDIANPN